MGMEVGRRMAALIPVHMDRYSSEVADARHAPMLAVGFLKNIEVFSRPRASQLRFSRLTVFLG